MGTRGWNGDPPADDADARRRIVAAAMSCVDRHGPTKTGLSDVAAELGVTRQTVYRHFPSTADLMVATAIDAAAPFLDRLAAACSRHRDPTDIVVTAVVWTVTRLPQERHLSLLLWNGRADLFARGVTSPTALEFARAMLVRLDVDWDALGYRPADLDGLAEFLLRFMQSMFLDPGDPPRSERALRAYVRRWIGPAVAP